MQVPCGRCIGCRLEKSRQWAIRMTHEAQMHQNNCFLTLTYNDENLPKHNSLHYPDVQKFLKRLRKIYKTKLSYYLCGEYGDHTARPHYHICLFGIDFKRDRCVGSSELGHKIYSNDRLETIWGKGHISFGELNFESAAYCARYVTKKVTGEKAAAHYGERIPEFARMSTRPAIGKHWLQKYSDDVFNHGLRVRGGQQMSIPRYYKKMAEQEQLANYTRLKTENHIRTSTDEYKEESSRERLITKEFIKKEKLKSLRRKL